MMSYFSTEQTLKNPFGDFPSDAELNTLWENPRTIKEEGTYTGIKYAIVSIEKLHDIGFYDIYGHIFVAGETENIIRAILNCDVEWKKRDYQLTGEVVESIVNAVKELIAYHELIEIEMRKRLEEYPHLQSVERELEKAHEIGEKILGTPGGEILIELIVRFREHLVFIFRKRENIKRYLTSTDCPNLEEEI